jgi:hypothetical protein
MLFEGKIYKHLENKLVPTHPQKKVLKKYLLNKKKRDLKNIDKNVFYFINYFIYLSIAKTIIFINIQG